MPYKPTASDYEPMTPLRRARAFEDDEGAGWPTPRAEDADAWPGGAGATLTEREGAESGEEEETVGDGARRVGERRKDDAPDARAWPPLRRGHAASFAGLLLFTAFVYFRPYELVTALAPLKTGAFWIAAATLAVFIPTQFALEGTPTARPREVNLVLLLLLAGLLSVPLAIAPAEAWGAWVEFAKVVTMFVVMINVVRTESRLRAMFWTALLVSVVLSLSALADYRAGRLSLNGARIEGVIEGGLFGNPNDMALHLVTMIPLVVGLLSVARGISKKMLYGAMALLMLLATVATLSRGGLLGLACASFVMAWKVGRRRRWLVVLAFGAAGAIFLVLLPTEFTLRLLSIFGGEADGGSAVARQGLLIRSLYVSLFNPLLGIGMNNFHIVSIQEQVSHNAYTQVSAEMGMPALILYAMFMLSTLRRLRRVERETFEDRARARVYYLAVALQASIVAYMVSSFFASVAYLWYVYYLAGYALCLHRLYESKGAEAFGRAVRPRVRAADEGDAGEDGALARESEDVSYGAVAGRGIV
ncbi:MAG TPA: O-antigen ligase family protein [Pyrinomonadaceae bacterium]|nr:O-antigen ligase family protein [Pyrinomonadaceae bacterium]